MKLSLKRISLISIIGLSIGLLSFKVNYFEISKNIDIYTSLFKELNTYYVDEIDPSEVMQNGIKSMLKNLDPYTNYISEAELEGYKMQTTGKYGGIGAIIRRKDDFVIVDEPYEGYPAQLAGLKAGDRILEVDGVVAEGKTTYEVSKILKGQPDTEVEVLIGRPGIDSTFNELTVHITRKEVKIKNVPYYDIIDEGVAYIRLTGFTQNAGKEVGDALVNLKDSMTLKGVILDLRGNPGGLLNEAVNVTNVFVKKNKEIVSTKGKIDDWNKTFKTRQNPVDIEIPLVVLVNNGSASAAEIVSGAIQDLDRGIVIGKKTFGKGLVQTTRSLPYNTKLKLTTAKYYIPSGRCIQAIDYTRNEDGEVLPKEMPDSLKQTFKTKNGRTVYDGGGIEPDIEVETDVLSNISASLLTNDLFFDFATQFAVQQASIAKPKTFQIEEALYQQFLSFVDEEGEYEYTTESERHIEKLKNAAEEEKYLEAIEQLLVDLEQMIQEDKEKDIEKETDEIKRILKLEIISRYYYQRGVMEARITVDEEIKEALEILSDKKEYNNILN